ncbi:MAG: SMC-Scp complex subunit ScpB [Candidatus Acidiferrales bacterium]
MDRNELKALLEAIIYVSEEPVTLDALAKAMKEVPREELRAVLKEMAEATHAPDRGVEIRVVAGGYRMYTKAEHHEAVRRFVRSQKPPLRLSMPALETLAVIAYKQPVTGPEIESIRGVDPSSALATLLDKGLVVTAGRKPCVGRPILYRTSKEFLIRFGLSGVDELPTLREFEELARAALGDAEMGPPSPEEPAAEPRAEPVAEEKPAEPEHA